MKTYISDANNEAKRKTLCSASVHYQIFWVLCHSYSNAEFICPSQVFDRSLHVLKFKVREVFQILLF